MISIPLECRIRIVEVFTLKKHGTGLLASKNPKLLAIGALAEEDKGSNDSKQGDAADSGTSNDDAGLW